MPSLGGQESHLEDGESSTKSWLEKRQFKDDQELRLALNKLARKIIGDSTQLTADIIKDMLSARESKIANKKARAQHLIYLDKEVIDLDMLPDIEKGTLDFPPEIQPPELQLQSWPSNVSHNNVLSLEDEFMESSEVIAMIKDQLVVIDQNQDDCS